MNLKVSEIFKSIQGEAGLSGTPCTFVRLYGCNLSCKWCDTKYAKEGFYKTMNVEEVGNKVIELMPAYVSITGGEPLVQRDSVLDLTTKLLALGSTVEINTNGSLPIFYDIDNDFKGKLRWVVDYKLPSSGEWGKFDWDNIPLLKTGDDLVFVIADRDDFEIAREASRAINKINENVICNFSPCFGQLQPDELVDWILKEELGVRLNLQLHKIIWDPERRGV